MRDTTSVTATNQRSRPLSWRAKRSGDAVTTVGGVGTEQYKWRTNEERDYYDPSARELDQKTRARQTSYVGRKLQVWDERQVLVEII